MSADKTYYWPQSGYYGSGSKIEAIEVIEQFGLGYHLGNVVKYVLRAGNKPGEDQLKDLAKALSYLERKVAQLSSQENENLPGL